MKPSLWTQLRTRLTLVKSQAGKPFTWLFLPGGPGIGSESLADLTSLLNLPGSMWHVDLPGDGSNLVENDAYYFARWDQALVEAVSAFSHVVLVAHSTGGMQVLSNPALEHLLDGLVLIASAPNADWQEHFSEYCQNNPLPGFDNLQRQLVENPTNHHLKLLTILSLPYSFTDEGQSKGRQLFEHLPFNLNACTWSRENFDDLYCAKWVPKNIPTLILAGEYDHITPIDNFKSARAFQRQNIDLQVITHAGHFPWLENPSVLSRLFQKFLQVLESHF